MILGIDTATARLGVAICDGTDVVASACVQRGNAHDELLAPLCRDLVAHAGIGMEDLTAVAVSAGPGSFTGLRIGMAVAKGFALGLGIPLVAVPTLDAAAEHVSTRWPVDDRSPLAVCIESRRDDVYVATYEVHGAAADVTTRWLGIDAVRVVDARVLAGQLGAGTILAGDGAERVAALAAEAGRAGGSLRVLPEPVTVFDGRAVARLGARLLAARGPDDADNCEPLYVQEFEVKPAKNLLLS